MPQREQITISFPPPLAKRVKAIADEEGMTQSEFFRSAVRHYLEERAWRKLYRLGEAWAKKYKVREEDVGELLDEMRS